METGLPQETNPNPSTSRFSLVLRAAAIAAAVFNAAVLCAFVEMYAFRVPFWETWDGVGRMQMLLAGDALRYFGNWYGNHRSILPIFIETYSALWTRWDLMAIVRLDLALAAATAALLALWARMQRTVLGDGALIVASAAFLFGFSARGEMSWLWSFRLNYYSVAFFAVCGLAALSRPAAGWGGYCASLTAGLLATGCYATGVLFWPAGLIVLASREFDSTRKKKVMLSLWGLTAAAVVWYYSRDFKPLPWYLPPGQFIAERPLKFIRFALTYLGAPLAFTGPYTPVIAMTAASAGLFLFAALQAALLRTSSSARRSALAFASPGYFAILSALLTSAGRGSTGLMWAKRGQYGSTAQLLWISLFALGAIYIQSAGPGREGRVKALKAAGAAAFALAFAVSLASLPVIRTHGENVRAWAPRLLDIDDPKNYVGLCFRPVNKELAYMKKHGLNLFNGSESMRRYLRQDGE